MAPALAEWRDEHLDLKRDLKNIPRVRGSTASRLYGQIEYNKLEALRNLIASMTTCFPSQLPPLPNNQRLAKHLKMLHALSESASLSTENTEEAVNDFDDRLKRAQAKEKIISKMTGDSKGDTEVSKMV